MSEASGASQIIEPQDAASPYDNKTLVEMTAVFIAAAKLSISLRPKRPTREELWRRKQERDRKSLDIALNIYAERNKIQPNELEIVEVKLRTQIIESMTEYLHFNFLVKCSDGATKLFFAEINAGRTGEKGVYLCTPVEESDCGFCYVCIRDKDFKHPTSGAYMAGHNKYGDYSEEIDSDDDYLM